MTRKEQIKKQADIYTDNYSNYAEWSNDGWSESNDIELVEKAFIEGAKWADEHPNLYNNEKYHTVKVSCLDELNRKAVLYDAFLEKACEYLRTHLWQNVDDDNDPIAESIHNITLDDFIKDFKRYLEE